eukprot:NODE_26086_length_564_cov_6.906178.p1 GENE.NODE_26086_length_564_cov_6.906178~~NODE_26086_length_564_cov_6.906178.p1  ORF type:complete len:72 (-),score=6.17 NODE_26086_length_564_cov_6.906178:197-412(-)
MQTRASRHWPLPGPSRLAVNSIFRLREASIVRAALAGRSLTPFVPGCSASARGKFKVLPPSLPASTRREHG